MLACLTTTVYSGLSFSMSGIGPNVAETQGCVRGKNVAFILQVTEHLRGPETWVGTGNVVWMHGDAPAAVFSLMPMYNIISGYLFLFTFSFCLSIPYLSFCLRLFFHLCPPPSFSLSIFLSLPLSLPQFLSLTADTSARIPPLIWASMYQLESVM